MLGRCCGVAGTGLCWWGADATPRRKRLQKARSRGVSRVDAATNEFWLPMCLASECHHGLQDVGCAQKRSATRRASSDTIEQSPRQGRGLHLCGRALRGALQGVSMISTDESTRITVLVTVEASDSARPCEIPHTPRLAGHTGIRCREIQARIAVQSPRRPITAQKSGWVDSSVQSHV